MFTAVPYGGVGRGAKPGRVNVERMSLRTIAEMAGVSVSTVSLGLRGSQKIPAATRERVARIAAEIGYRPNAKVTELMSQVRLSRTPAITASLGVVSFFGDARPWESAPALRRIYESMARRAEDLGYRLEPLWLRAPDLTVRRVCGILDARGIEGLICLGSPDQQEIFPSELDHYAVVAQGPSVTGSLHRVMTHAAGDMARALDATFALGYRKPGLAIGPGEAVPGRDAHIGAYLGWCYKKWGRPAPIPLLKLDAAGDATAWLGQHAPDVVIAVHDTPGIVEFGVRLQRHGVRWPADIGLAAIAPVLEGTGFSGLQENHRLIGQWTVEMLVERILHHELGLPEVPRLQLVESQWLKGNSLRLNLG